MGLFKHFLGLFDAKSELVKRLDEFEKVAKPLLIRRMVYMRMVRQFRQYNASDVESSIQGLDQIKSVVDGSSDMQLLGTPEATIVVTLQQFFGFKALYQLTDSEVFRKIELLRNNIGSGCETALPGTDLSTFTTRIIRGENPDCTPQILSDEAIRDLVEYASDEMKKLFPVSSIRPI